MSHLETRTLPGYVRTVSPDLLHSHSLARVFLPFDLPTSPPLELQD